MKISKKHTAKINKKVVLGLLVVVLVALAGWLIYRHNQQPTVSKQTAPITALPAHAAANNGEKKSDAASGDGSRDGTVTDNKGIVSDSLPSSDKWTTSSSGQITVKTPTSGATLTSGAALIGTSKVGQVQYRLIDDQVGVISQGFISVVNNTFSGSLKFQSHSSTGRLDVFNSDENGKELNEVQIPVKY